MNVPGRFKPKRIGLVEVIAGPSTADDYPDRDADLFLALASDRLSVQLEFIDAVDNKIGLLVSVASGLMGILAAVFALKSLHSPSTQTDPGLGWAEWLTLAGAAIAYLFAAFHGLKAYFARGWNVGPPLNEVWDQLWTEDDDRLIKWKVANSIWSCYRGNLATQVRKRQAVPWVLTAVVIQSLLVSLALVLVAVD